MTAHELRRLASCMLCVVRQQKVNLSSRRQGLTKAVAELAPHLVIQEPSKAALLPSGRMLICL